MMEPNLSSSSQAAPSQFRYALPPVSLSQPAAAAMLSAAESYNQCEHIHLHNTNTNNNNHINSQHYHSQALPLTRLTLDYLVEPLESLDNKLDYYLTDFWLQTGDERTSKLPFMGSGPWKLLIATLVYLYLVKWLLPRLMQNVRPFELQWPIRCYNLLMVASNLYAFYHGARILRMGYKCFGCEVINHRDYSAQAIELLHYGWLFFLSRLFEWLDTIFFVLRKKKQQVTKLHVFHHSFVPILCWIYLKYHPGYTVAFFPLVNTFVHTIMYTYYLLATFGPKIAPYLWWKKYLTSLQIVQFVLILIQLATIPLSSDEKCQYPRAFLYVAFAGAILFLWLFYTYYVDTYKAAAAAAASTSSINTADTNRRAIGESSCRETTTTTRAPVASPRRQANGLSAKARDGSSRALGELIEDSIGVQEANHRQHHDNTDKNKKFL